MKPKRVGSTLDNFKLHYEEMEFNKVKTSGKTTTTVKAKATPSKPKVSVKARLTGVKAKVRTRFNNVVKKIVPHRKKAKKTTKIEKKLNHEQQMRGILGIGLLFVVVSIIYSTYVIFNGVSSTASRVMLIPQVVFAALTLFKAFSKIYK